MPFLFILIAYPVKCHPGLVFVRFFKFNDAVKILFFPLHKRREIIIQLCLHRDQFIWDIIQDMIDDCSIVANACRRIVM
jgi:hypothetical protein